MLQYYDSSQSIAQWFRSSEWYYRLGLMMGQQLGQIVLLAGKETRRGGGGKFIIIRN